MLKEKFNLKTMFLLLYIVAFVMIYLSINIQMIDMLYLVFVLFFIVKCIFYEKIK